MSMLVRSLPSQPEDIGEPLFREPWEAQVFAITVETHRRGLFEWNEWTSMLAAQIALAQESGDPDLGDTYYHHWLAAFEKLVLTKGLSSGQELARYRNAWARSAHRTPHGQSTDLQPNDFENA